MDAVAKFIRTHAKSDMVALDIGANAGLYTGLLSDLCYRVHSFEPNKEILHHLKYASRKGNVTIVEKAVSRHSGEVTFHLDIRPGVGAVASSINSLDDLAQSNQIRDIIVPCTTIDEYCLERNISPDLIKIDVEGHEFAVVEGGLKTISRVRPTMIFEFWESHWERGRFKELFELLHPMYHLRVAQTGADAWEAYMSPHASRNGSVDIGCVPR